MTGMNSISSLKPSEKRLNRLAAPLLILFTTSFSSVPAVDFKPKYGPEGSPKAVPLSQMNDYFRVPTHLAPEFWALISFYVPQFNDAACSAASLAMVLNAGRAPLTKSADDPVIRQEDLLKKVTAENWKARLSLSGHFGSHGVNLNRFGKIIEAAFKTYHLDGSTVQVVHMSGHSTETQNQMHEVLIQKKPGDFFIANFDQEAFTNDAAVGHFAPVGAYDPDRRQVLILDPDRHYYEPYWVSLSTFIEGMATQDPETKQNRGYLKVHINVPQNPPPATETKSEPSAAERVAESTHLDEKARGLAAMK